MQWTDLEKRRFKGDLSYFTVEEVGCFKDNTKDRVFPTMLKNLRPEIDWYHLEKTIQKCALLTKQHGYQASSFLNCECSFCCLRLNCPIQVFK